ncbi:MAG: hypothetical protein DHS20C16_06050 [Phycisphaerae bacterium]|nr:MAG: hypothetical protein DHS20C16_06050 [Phycisphaerae bacterium]
MLPNDLEQLLQHADRAAYIDLTSPGELANQARYRVRKQKQVRIAVGASAGIALLLFVFNFANRSVPVDNDQPQIAKIENAPTAVIDNLEAKIKALREEADRLESIVRANRQAAKERTRTASFSRSRTSTRRSKPMPIPAQLLIEQESEITARVMVEQANQWIKQPDRRDDAIRTFERTVKLFPTTTAAKTAQNCLTELKNQSGATI